MKNNVVSSVVSKGFCIGCGVCAGVCPSKALTVKFDNNGEYKAFQTGECRNKCTLCLNCCPQVDKDQNEDTIAYESFGIIPNIQHRTEIGYFLDCYEGYSVIDEHRKNGASGGLCTWFLEQLLLRKEVDGVICVRQERDPHKIFEYFIAHDINELRQAASSAYYPVELSEVLQELAHRKERYAVVGLPCFLTALSLAQRRIPMLKNRITYKIGLVCGKLPNKEFIGNLIDKVLIPRQDVMSVRFRDKRQYSNQMKGITLVRNDGTIINICEDHVAPELWGSGIVTPTACLFCDDIFAETADLVFMDAWLPEYHKDHYGHSIAVTRSQLADRIFMQAASCGANTIKRSDVTRVLQAQQPRIKNKRNSLHYRFVLAKKWGIPFPQKRIFLHTAISMLDKMNIIEKFYRQQKAHGVVLPVRYRCDAIFAILFNAAIDRLWKTIRPIIKRMRIR